MLLNWRRGKEDNEADFVRSKSGIVAVLFKTDWFCVSRWIFWELSTLVLCTKTRRDAGGKLHPTVHCGLARLGVGCNRITDQRDGT